MRVLIHSLGFGSPALFIGAEASVRGVPFPRQMEMTLDVMANSLVYWTQDLLAREMMGEGGRIIAMSSHGSHRVLPGYGAVGTAKAALEANVRELAVELAPRGITVNTIRAGLTDTRAFRAIPTSGEMLAQVSANASGRPHYHAGGCCGRSRRTLLPRLRVAHGQRDQRGRGRKHRRLMGREGNSSQRHRGHKGNQRKR